MAETRALKIGLIVQTAKGSKVFGALSEDGEHTCFVLTAPDGVETRFALSLDALVAMADIAAKLRAPDGAGAVENGGRTGWPPGMLQDDSRQLSRALASKPDAKLHAREAVAASAAPEVEEVPRTVQCKQCLAIMNEGNGCTQLGCPLGELEPVKGCE